MSKKRGSQWAVGDRAVHVDGGPEMEVTGSNGRTVWCRWMQDDQLRTRVIPAEELQRVWDKESINGRVVALRVGMVVQHLFGGPDMTVIEIVDRNAWCQWSADSHPRSGQFPCVELVEIPTSKAVAAA